MSNIDLLSPKEASERLSIPISTLYRWISEGKFPRPIKIGPRRTAFKIEDIIEWRENQEEAKSILHREDD
ncbi:MAG: AlpA family phage regulatory protein [Balneolaceae bacterium]|nr:AlpA family phage regulatory protein [Balneolaceae bacterium]